MLFQKSKKKSETQKLAIPIKAIENEFLLRTDGHYCAVFSASPVNMALLQEDEAEAVVTTLRTALNTVPDRIQLFVSSERLNLDDYIDYLKPFADDADDSEQYEQIDAMIEEIQTRSVRNQKVLRFYIAVQSQFTKEDAALAEFADLEQTLGDILSGSGLSLNRLNRQALYSLLYNKLCPEASMFEPATRDMQLQDLYPSVIDTKTSPRYYIVDGIFMKSFTITSYPTSQEQAAWMTTIFTLPIDVDVSITLAQTDKDKVLKHMNKSIRNIREMKGKSNRDALASIRLEQEEKDALYNLQQMASENESLFATAIVLTIRAHTLDELNNHEKTLRTRVSGLQMRSRPLLRMDKDPLWYSLPICYKGILENYVRYDMPAETVASIQPFNSSTLAGNTGIVTGENARSHDLIILDNETRANNPHTVYLARTRAGKSFALFADILRKKAQGEICIDIDPERERQNIPGNHIVFSLSNDTCLNVFHIRSTIVDTEKGHGNESTKPGEYLRLKIERNMTFFRYIYPDMNNLEYAALEQAQRHVYAQHNLDFDSETLPDIFPTLSEFCEALTPLSNTANFLDAIAPFVGDGNYARMFDGQTNFSFTETKVIQHPGGEVETRGVPAMYTRLDIHELEEGPAQAPLMDLLLKDIWEFVKMDRNVVKNFDVDEAWILANPKFSHGLKFLHDISKRGGKYGVRLTTATQNVADFLRTAQGDSISYGEMIIANSGVKILMQMENKDIERIMEFLPLSARERKLLRPTGRPGRGRGILIVGDQRAEMQTFMTPAEWRLYDPHQYAKLYG